MATAKSLESLLSKLDSTQMTNMVNELGIPPDYQENDFDTWKARMYWFLTRNHENNGHVSGKRQGAKVEGHAGPKRKHRRR